MWTSQIFFSICLVFLSQSPADGQIFEKPIAVMEKLNPITPNVSSAYFKGNFMNLIDLVLNGKK